MCGIVGVLGKENVAPMLVDALKRLEYRGYDSAGVATLNNGVLDRRRAPGKLTNLEHVLSENPLPGKMGIGHTRWATHGVPNETNAHPHQTDKLAIVHNGIIENFRQLRESLTADGYTFHTETDTEAVAILLTKYLEQGAAPQEAVSKTLKQLRGAFALGMIFKDHDDLMIGARNGPPLAVGYGDGELYLGSDAVALSPFTNKISYLEDGDWVVLQNGTVSIYDGNDQPVDRQISQSTTTAYMVDKGNHRHFMIKEINEQADVVSHTLSRYLNFSDATATLPDNLPFDPAKLSRISISACGTAFLAGMVSKYWFERYARLPVDIDIASEFRYREMPMVPGGLSLFISQSGETADTLAGLRYCREQGQHIGSIVNVTESTIARESDVVLPTLAGPEIGVASTKAFTCQLSVLASLAIALGKAKGTLGAEQEHQLVEQLAQAPRYISEALKVEPNIEMIAQDLSKVKHVLYLGRDVSYPLAMEGALKLKEISYIHAEGYAAGELKHGPIALIDETMPVIVIAPHDHIFEKTVSNMQEVAARGGKIILITDREGANAAEIDDAKVIIMPKVPDILMPLVYSVPIQLLAYHTAVFMGTDVDQPRNLAKSVTVE